MRLLWSACQDATLQEVADRLGAAAKLFRTVTIEDLVAPGAHASTGLYFFHDGHDHWMYVGKSSSRAIIERVPAHLDIRPNAWFGTLMQKLGEHTDGRRAPSSVLNDAMNLKLALLLADVPVDLKVAEDAFIRLLRPTLNTPKKVKPISASTVMRAFAGGPAHRPTGP
ncbi:hypothetical protein [Sorangium sp. So ce854]|uniref:hypothetical protein n=1 Tax=Sorangium sp. So ce854 TaxID=3133322 RepID=UPI003F6042B3